MLLRLVDEAVKAGARQSRACRELGISCRMLQRWRLSEDLQDQRAGPRTTPGNKLSTKEESKIMKVVNSPEFRNLPPSQIVPLLADRGSYLASESTIYRLLRKAKQLRHRHHTKPRTKREVRPHLATGPLQVWSWDITYLRSCVRGEYYYLYLVLDVWSRMIVGYRVEEVESMDTSSALIAEICRDFGIEQGTLVLHSDNGSPMKGATMLATLEALGVAASFSRPSVSNDNPYSESLFGTMKYRPEYPQKPFASLRDACAWVDAFVIWYNHVHLHSAIGFVTPNDRHEGRDKQILGNRESVYLKARSDHPERWSGSTRDWSRNTIAELNPGRKTKASRQKENRKEVAA